MRYVALDTETFLIGRNFDLVPKLVCVSLADMADKEPRLLHARECEPKVQELLADDDVTLVGLNIAGFDLPVLLREFPNCADLICEKLKKGLVQDVAHVFRYMDLSQGKLNGEYDEAGNFVKNSYGLAALVNRSFGIEVSKGDDTWRLRYAELYDKAVQNWPKEARDYSVMDAFYTLALWESFTPDILHDTRHVPQECRAEFFLKLQSWTGLRTDREFTEKYILELDYKITQARQLCEKAGLVRSNGSRNTTAAKKLVTELAPAFGFEPALTDRGQISLAEKSLRGLKHPTIQAYLTYSTANSQKARADNLMHGCEGDNVLQTEYVIINSNGRTSSRKPSLPAIGDNFQNMPREGRLRECFVPHDMNTHYLCSVDYSMMELHTAAQCEIWMTGSSKLAEALNAQIDVHCYVAAMSLGCSYEEALANKRVGKYAAARQLAKGVNFGAWGGMGVKRLAAHLNALKGVDDPIVTEWDAKQLLNAWYAAWEPSKYFNAVKGLFDGGEGYGRTSITQYISGRKRGGVTFTEAANGFFSGLAVDAIKDALSELGQACLLATPRDKLYNVVPLLYIHDEVITEVPKATAHVAAMEQTRIQVDTVNAIWLPDVPVRAEPALMQRWYKKAEPVFDNNGELLPWEPKK